MIKHIYVPPYYYLIHLVIGLESLDKLRKKTKEDYDEHPPKSICGFTKPLLDDDDIDSCLVFLHSDSDIQTIYHEALHATHFMLESRGIPIAVENTEVVAYHQEWLVTEINRIFKKVREKSSLK